MRKYTRLPSYKILEDTVKSSITRYEDEKSSQLGAIQRIVS